jgi:hypothetical protein
LVTGGTGCAPTPASPPARDRPPSPSPAAPSQPAAVSGRRVGRRWYVVAGPRAARGRKCFPLLDFARGSGYD